MVLDALARVRGSDAALATDDEGDDDAGDEPGTDSGVSFTTVIRVGTEPTEVARTSIILAARAGPTVVIATTHRAFLDELGPVVVPVHIAPTIEAALRDAAATITTDAMIIVSASAFPLANACRAAAARLRDDVGWVTGYAASPNGDRYAPREREMLAERLRSSARTAGATLWEPDATMLRTDLVLAHPIDPGRPWGAWLRSLERRGYRGIEIAAPIALRAAPADAPAFWPSQMMRTRAGAADLAGASRHGPRRARLLSAASLLRELYAWPLALWAIIPLLIGWSGSFPLSHSPIFFIAAAGAVTAGRWTATRLSHGVALRPVHEARAAAYDAPGSLLAMASVLRGRIRPRRINISDQPLLWFTIVFTFATTVLILQRAATSDSGADIAAGAAIANLVVLWTFAIRAIGKRGWDRTVYRLVVDLPALVAEQPAHISEASPTGLAATGEFAHVEVGTRVPVVVDVPGHPPLELDAVVANRRAGAHAHAHPEHVVLGLALQLDAYERREWIGALFDAARITSDHPLRPSARAGVSSHDRAPLAHALAFRFEMLLVGATSLFAASVLAFVLLGFRPLVISSGSMRPTLSVGEVVVTSRERADQVHVGDIVTFEDHTIGELITHRVRSITSNGNDLRIETRGDANSVSEIWDIPRHDSLRRTVWEVPGIGATVTDLGSPAVRVGLVAAGLVFALVTGAAVQTSRRTQRASMKSTAPAGDVDPKNRAVPNESIEPSSPSR